MKNVIALGLVACAALTSVNAEAKFINSDVESWKLACSDHNVPHMQFVDKNKKLFADYGTPAWNKQQKARNAFVEGCAKFMSTFDLDVEFNEEYGTDGAYAGMKAYLEKVKAPYTELLTMALEQNAPAKAKQEVKAQAPKAAVKSYYIMDVLNTPALKSQLKDCEATPDAARVIAQIKSDMQEARFQYQQEVQFLRDNGMDGFAANRQASKTILDPANQNAKFNTERADKFVNKCLSQNYGWTFHN